MSSACVKDESSCWRKHFNFRWLLSICVQCLCPQSYFWVLIYRPRKDGQLRWLFGIRAHASRPHKIRNAVPYPLGHTTTFMLSLINQLVHPSIHWFIYSCIHSLIHTLFHELMHLSIQKFTYIFIHSCIYWCCPTFINGSCCQYYQLLPTLISFPLASNLKLKYPFLKLCALKANFW